MILYVLQLPTNLFFDVCYKKAKFNRSENEHKRLHTVHILSLYFNVNWKKTWLHPTQKIKAPKNFYPKPNCKCRVSPGRNELDILFYTP